MDFYSRQATARGQTRWLIVGFILSLLAVALALDLVLFSFFTAAAADQARIAPLEFAAANPAAALMCTLTVMGVLGLASVYKTLELRGGGGVVARNLGGVLVDAGTTDPKRKRLLNVVSEMAIASGVAMPEVYVLEQEPAINAFAAGHSAANAAVTVTQGALERLNRDELQGVIGHEFSHILNGDMRLNVELMGWVFGLFVVALIGRLILNFAPRDRRSNNGVIALGFAVMVLGYVGLFLGRVMQAAVSRQRERLADASGVQFTRNPQGLKNALIKIATLEEGSQLLTPHAEQAAHMFFAPGMERLFATHPPILERIRELDPQFDERELARAAADSLARDTDSLSAPDTGMPAADSVAGFAATVPTQERDTNLATVPTAEHVVARVGRTDFLQLQQAGAINLALPDEVRALAQSPQRAQAFVLALLLSQDPEVRRRQLLVLTQKLPGSDLATIQQLAPIADGLAPLLRLPALQQVFPALRRAPSAQRQALGERAADLIHADSRIDAFEFCLAKLLETLLIDEREARAPHGTLTLEDAEGQIGVLFAALAQLGAGDERSARIAYEAGMSSVLPMRRPEYAARPDWADRLNAALPALVALHPFAKKAVIEGLVRTLGSDGIMTEAETELLRTVCALMHCPLPPLLTGALASG